MGRRRRTYRLVRFTRLGRWRRSRGGSRSRRGGRSRRGSRCWRRRWGRELLLAQIAIGGRLTLRRVVAGPTHVERRAAARRAEVVAPLAPEVHGRGSGEGRAEAPVDLVVALVRKRDAPGVRVSVRRAARLELR